MRLELEQLVYRDCAEHDGKVEHRSRILDSGLDAGATAGIVISGFAFSGAMTVKPGQKVTVTNQDSVAHTLTDRQTHKFDTGNIPGNGGTGTFTAPTTPGSYPFGCTYHPDMHGTLVVR